MDIKRKSPTTIAGRSLGPDKPARLMGVINVSPESFFKGSIPSSEMALAKLASRLENEGADFIDVGAMSTAPYLKTEISEREEAKRLAAAVQIIRKNSSLPISIDTSRFGPAESGLEAGAAILNDVTGLTRDPKLGKLAAQAEGVILMANPKNSIYSRKRDPISVLTAHFHSMLKTAQKVGIKQSRLVLDPGIGFFREELMSWWQWDLTVLMKLKQLSSFQVPLLVGVSRKSFIGHILGNLPPEKRLEGSLAATIIAVQNGASLIRTHDVLATKRTLDLAASWS